MYTYGNSNALQALITTRDNALLAAHEAYFKKLADAAFTYTQEVADAILARDLAIANAEHKDAETAAGVAKAIRDVTAEVNHWIQGVKIKAEYAEEKELRAAAEKRARAEAESKHKEQLAQIDADYKKELASIKAAEDSQTAKGSANESVLNSFAGFISSPAAELQFAESQAEKKEKDATAAAKAERDRKVADRAKQLAIALADEALQHSYRLAEASRIASLAIAGERKGLRDHANDSVRTLHLDRSWATYSQQKREALGKQLDEQRTAGTAHEFDIGGATPTKDRAYEMAKPEAQKIVFPNSTSSSYAQAVAEATYNYEIAMITVNQTHRENQADDHHDSVTGLASDEATTTMAGNGIDHSVRSLLIQHLVGYDSTVISILETAVKNGIGSSATLGDKFQNGLYGLHTDLTELERIYGEKVADAARQKEVDKVKAKSEKSVQSYQNHRDRVAQFASHVSTAWGNMNLKQADAQLDREAKIKQEGDKRAIDDADSYFKLASKKDLYRNM